MSGDTSLLNPPAVYAAKTGVCVTLIEAIGNLLIAHYEKPGGAESKMVETLEFVGTVADIGRVADTIDNAEEVLNESVIQPAISFTGNANDQESMKKIVELTKKLESAQGKVKQYSGYVESDIRFNRDTSTNASNLKFWNDQVAAIQRQIQKVSQ
jgi:hypothetical protein